MRLLLCVYLLAVLAEAAPFNKNATAEDNSTTEEIETTEELTTTENPTNPTTTQETTTKETTTTSTRAPFGDLVIAETKDKSGKPVDKIDGELKLNGKSFEVKCSCADFTTSPPKSPTTSCPNYRDYKITKLTSVLSRKGGENGLSKLDIRNMLPQSADLEFVPVKSTTLCDVDHRDQGPIMAGNGGDAAEFVIALQAFQFLCRGELSEQTVQQLLRKYLKQISPRQFYFRTSKDAMQHLNQEIGHFIALDGTPSAADQSALLGAYCLPGKQCGLMSADGMGDVVLKGMLNSHGKYFVNQTLVRHFIKAYFKRKWSNPTDTQLIVDSTKQEDQFRHQKAVVLLKTNAECHKEGTAPILRLPLQRRDSPTAGGVYVYQHDAVSMRREELAHFFAGHLASIRQDLSNTHSAALMKLMCNSLGNRALEQTLRAIATGLPLFGVELVMGDASAPSKQLLKAFTTTAAKKQNEAAPSSEVDIGDFLNE